MQIQPFKKKVWLSSPTMHGEEMEYIKQAYETNWMSTVGANINEVERMTCEYVGCKHAVALASGTSALHLAMKLAGVKPGMKVFCSDVTFAATVNPVTYEGGIPVFIDSERDTWNMDPEALKKAFELYPEVKVVVVANLYGTPAKLDELRAICDENGLPVNSNVHVLSPLAPLGPPPNQICPQSLSSPVFILHEITKRSTSLLSNVAYLIIEA